jgi:two-component system response regulator DesR
LIIDDHEVFRSALRALLRTEGFDAADVGAGDAAIPAAIAFRPDVAIIDVAPGRGAGFRIARELRALPDPPSVLLTSSASTRQFGSRLGPHPFAAKADLCGDAIIKLAIPQPGSGGRPGEGRPGEGRPELGPQPWRSDR